MIKYDDFSIICNQYTEKDPLTPFRNREDAFCKESKFTVEYCDENLPNADATTSQPFRELPWFDYDPQAMRLFKQHWRNYIKPGYFQNAGDLFINYDSAKRENKMENLTPGITSEAYFPHTQINIMNMDEKFL